MNILYISHLFKKASSGPNYSVPAQIKAQSKLDNVFWLETTDTYFEFWLESGVFHNANEYKNVKIAQLPTPFNKPDLVVFEGFYFFEYIKYAKECRNLKIPYVIVPRSSLTKQGQKQKRLKKLVANFIFFNKFAKKASGIQFLTNKELNDSGFKWNKNNFVIPNGMVKRDLINREIKDNLEGCYIGRFAIYQKGLDLLLKACKLIKDKLINANISISFYGFDNQEKIQFKKDI